MQLALSLTSVLSGSVSNEARLLVGQSGFDQSANSDRPGVERPSGTFGGNNLNRQNRTEDRIELVDNISWQTGRHALKFGADILRSRTNVETAFNPNGNFLYNTDQRFEPGDCGDLYLSQINDPANHVDPNDINSPVICPGVVGVDDDGDGLFDEPGIIQSYPVVFQLIEGKPAATLNDTRLALFAQDTWEVSTHLKLNYGLRYDLSTFVLPSSASVDSTIPNGGAGRDTNNLAPRLGFTWTPGTDGRTVVRGGAGIFYDKLALGFPAVTAITSGTQIGLFFPQGLTVELTGSSRRGDRDQHDQTRALLPPEPDPAVLDRHAARYPLHHAVQPRDGAGGRRARCLERRRHTHAGVSPGFAGGPQPGADPRRERDSYPRGPQCRLDRLDRHGWTQLVHGSRPGLAMARRERLVLRLVHLVEGAR